MKLNKNNSGQRLWKKANRVIIGGNGLLSKRPERYAPDLWPVYFKKAKGCYLWDLDGNKFLDMAQNGIGSAILGYSNSLVNKAVIDSIKNGINTTLNPPEEVYLAEMLLKLNPSMQKVKFAKGGGEAMSIAVRIARAHSKKDKILFSGYHGWSDWYLAANVASNENLDEHLIPGLNPIGVPKALRNSAVPFLYNDIDDFKRKLSEHKDISAIVIEGARYDEPNIDFLKCVEYEAKRKKIILIVDEITSGFRLCNSGTYIKYKYDPDIVVYGKALGNGFPISAIVGKEEFMKSGELTFMSSTMWTERVGFVAALETLKILTEKKIYKQLIKNGKYIAKIWSTMASKYNLKIKISNFYPLVTFKLDYAELNESMNTLFIQEMLKRNILASNSVYLTASHSLSELNIYSKACDQVFCILRKSLDSDIKKYLHTTPRYDSFKRLNEIR